MLNKFLKNKTYSLILIISLFSGCGGTSGNSTTVLSETKDYTKISLNQQELLNAINEARSVQRDCYPDDSNYGVVGPVPPLYWNEELYASALEHSTDLAYSNTFSHYGSGTDYDITGNGSPSAFNERILANGYGSYYSVGENIAGGQQSIEEVMEAWLASPGHCSNIMSDKYTEVGVAIVTREESTYGIYWTQNFGSKRQ
ncbi:CAP domain-containing protein [bacterium]|nr:CAP domain-containing protein [bacterium]MBU1958369.1 CAP domain-containing protein [bacterium]